MADTGWLDATAIQTDSAVTYTAQWSVSGFALPANVGGSPVGVDGSWTEQMISDVLIGSNFDFSSIPVGATITKVEVRVEVSASAQDYTDGPNADINDFSYGQASLWRDGIGSIGSRVFWGPGNDGSVPTSPTYRVADFGLPSGFTLAGLDYQLGFTMQATALAYTGSYFINVTASKMQMRVTYEEESEPETYTGSAALTTPAATVAISGTFTPPTYNGSASLTTAAATVSIAGTFAPPPVTGSIALTLPAVQAAIAGTFSPPNYSGSIGLTTAPATVAIAGSFTAPTYSGLIALTTPAAQASIAGAFTPPTYAAAIALTTKPATVAISGSFTPAVVTGSIALTAAAARVSIAGTFVVGVLPGPFYIAAMQAMQPGAVAADSYVPGAKAAQATITGPTAGDSL